MIKSLFGRLSRSSFLVPNFIGSRLYWDQRYRTGGNSGSGSYGRLAAYKADFINEFVRANEIQSVVEFGCGDGNQLWLGKYPSYLGLDISESALAACRTKFANDSTKQFLGRAPAGLKFELALSLDVIYHLVEDDVFEEYMQSLFNASSKWVIVYASNFANADFLRVHPDQTAPHVFHRPFVEWVSANQPRFELIKSEKNRFPFDPRDGANTSFADFFVFEKRP